jgi:Protein of unknown function (DUF3780)
MAAPKKPDAEVKSASLSAVQIRPRALSHSKRTEVEGFGCPLIDWPHHVRVVIPEIRGGTVQVIEAFGVGGHAAGQPEEIERCVLPRPRWNAIADVARREFNERLRMLGLPVGAWRPGATKVERMLGQELILLACACAAADEPDIPATAESWAALRPEERWWFAGWLQSHPSPRVLRGAALLLSSGTAEVIGRSLRAPKPEVTLPLFDITVGKR